MPSQVLDLRGQLPVSADPDNIYGARPLLHIKQIAFHHCGSPPYNLGVAEFARRTAQYHVSKGWPGSAYQQVIGTDGVIDICWGLEVISYGLGLNNDITMNICWEGDYRTIPVPDIMIEAGEMAARSIIQRVKVARSVAIGTTSESSLLPQIELAIIGHREDSRTAPTTCPGDFGLEAVHEVRRRIYGS